MVFLCALIGAITFIYLLPTLSAGFSGSDIGFAQIRGFAEYSSRNWYATVSEVNAQVASEHGGWFPVQWIGIALWMLEPSPVIARLLQVLMIVTDMLLFAGLIVRLSRSYSLALLSGIGTLLSMQLRKPHDAIIGGTLQLPFVLAMILIASILFANYLDNGRQRCGVLSLVIAFVSCSTHEIAYPLMFIFPIIASLRGRRVTIAIPFLVIPILTSLPLLVFHIGMPRSLLWIQRPDTVQYERFATDLIAALPTTYRAYGNVLKDGVPNFVYDTRFESIPGLSMAGGASCIVVGLGAFAALSIGKQRLKGSEARLLACLALLLGFSGALVHEPLIWRTGVPLGEADPAMFVAFFGAGLGFALALRNLQRYSQLGSLHAMVPPLAGLAAFLIFYGNVRANQYVVTLYQNQHETWRLITEAGEAQFFQRVPAGSTIVSANLSSYATTQLTDYRNVMYLLYQVSGRKYHVAPYNSILRGGRLCARFSGADRICKPHLSVWLLRRNLSGLFSGGLTAMRWAGTSGSTVLTERAVAFHRATSPLDRDTFRAKLATGGRGIEVESIADDRVGVVGVINRTCGAVDVEKAFDANGPRLSYAGGFSPPAPFPYYQFTVSPLLVSVATEAETWRYASSRSELEITPDACPPLDLQLVGNVYAPRPTIVFISAQGQRVRMEVGEGGSPLSLILKSRRDVPISVVLTTFGTAAAEDRQWPQFDRRRFPPPRLIVNAMTLTVVPPLAPAAAHA